ncbi:MAG: TonB-dependent receptor, partial [Deltaproteobacteria bacterium]|nr:TonB-dependent receptor [Deltaproteobacteria bacterium]
MNPYGANPEVNTEHWADVVRLCGELMEASGNPNADQTYYGIDYRDVVAGTTPTAPGALGAGFGGAFPHTVGNLELKPETADTWTVGVVFDSNFENPWISDLRVTVDWYDIAVEDAIGEQSTDLALQQCFDPAFNPTYDPNSPYCKGTPRTQAGAMGEIMTTFWNNGYFETSGIDLQINWAKDMGPGRVGFITTFNYLLDKKSTELLGVNPLVDYVGTTGPYQNGLFGDSYEWRSNTNLSYTWEDLRVGLVWRYVDGISSAAYATIGDTRTQRNPYSLFDLQASYNLTDNIWLRFGAENLLDEDPPFYNVETEPEENELTGGSIGGGGIYDTRGRRFYMGVRVNFE